MMNGKLQVLIFTLVLLAGMFAVSEGYFGGGGSVGKKKRSNLVQVPQEDSAFPRDTRNQEDYEAVPERRNQICETCKKVC